MSAKYKSGIDLTRPEKQPDLAGYAQTDAQGKPIMMEKDEVKKRQAPDYDPAVDQGLDPQEARRSDEVPGKRATGPGNKAESYKPETPATKAAAQKSEAVKQKTDNPAATRDNNAKAADIKAEPTKAWSV